MGKGYERGEDREGGKGGKGVKIHNHRPQRLKNGY